MNRVAETSILGVMLTDGLGNLTACACLKDIDFEPGYAELFQAIKDLPKDQRNDLIKAVFRRTFEPSNIVEYIKILKGDLPEVKP